MMKWIMWVVLWGCGVTLHSQSDEHLTTVFRQIGHEWLWSLGDSSTQILPIHQVSTNRYQIRYKRELGFQPDSLTQFFNQRMQHYAIPPPYQVFVKDCEAAQLLYSWEIYPDPKKSIIPCLGRSFPEACYYLEILLLTPPPAKSKTAYLVAFLFLVCGAGGYWMFQKNKPIEPFDHANHERFGLFTLNTMTNVMQYQNQTTTLTDKEGRLLQLLLQAKGQVVERDALLKEVWEDDEGLLLTRSVDVFVSRLRKHLRADPNIKLVAVHGRGYRLEVHAANGLHHTT